MKQRYMMMMLRSHTLWMMLLGWLLCLSPAWAQSTGKIYYVTADGQPLTAETGIQEAWTSTENVTTLETALESAKAGDQVWIKGYVVGSPEEKNVYRAPEGGFKVKSGVKVYGGFSGKESGEADRIVDGQVYRMRYRTVLTGDTGSDEADVRDPVNYIFPTSDNTNKRADNRTHVVDVDMTPNAESDNNNTEPTVLNGLVIARGQADGENETGGGVYIHGNNSGGGNFRIARCFFIANYGTMGGAVYVAAEVKNVNSGANLIDRCSFFNNAAGERGTNMNRGGAVCFIGQGYVYNSTIYNNENGGVIASKSGSAIVNCTITRNTGAGVDGVGSEQDEHLPVWNSVVWGNAMLSTATQDQKNFPDFRYSAYPEARMMGNDEAKHNVVLSDKNNAPGDATDNHPKGPSFTLPSVKIGYDADFNIQEETYPQWNWEPLEETSLVDKGSKDLYNSIKFASVAPDVDLNRNPRFGGTSIDIGAYEFQPLAEGRRRYVKQGGAGDKSGSSWANASDDLQKMINELATKEGPGEVWVAGGTYKPNLKLIDNANYSVAFRMHDGISVYGGFLGEEERKDERPAMEFPWESRDMASIVYLTGLEYNPDTSEGAARLENNRWMVSSESRHVVWFAPATYNNKADAPAFKYPTILDRVCVRGGNAMGATEDIADFESGKGGGVYMNDANAYMRNCVVKESSARQAGGGVYLKNGRIIGSLIYNCNAGTGIEKGKGGGVFVDEAGMVLRSMVTNNTADLGAGVFLNNDYNAEPNYLVLSTSVVSNNTARINGAVYCNKGGVLTQNTITNNYCPTAPDQANKEAAQTGGVYVNTYGTVINSVIWNNKIDLTGTGKDNATDIPVFAFEPTSDKVRFLYNAISGRNNAVWNNTLQQGTLTLGDKNSTTVQQMGPDFGNTTDAAPGTGESEGTVTDASLEQNVGALGEVKWIGYYWSPKTGSNLLAMGMPIGQFPGDVLITPELDITGTDLFDQKPSAGAFQVNHSTIKPEETDEALIFYVDGENTAIDADGASWATAHRSLIEAVNHFAGLTKEQVGNRQLTIRVKGQELWPRFAFANEDPRTATLKIPVTESGEPIVIEGSWQVEGDKAERNPLQLRTILNSNREGSRIEEGNYHCVNIDPNAKLVLDGFHIINGYAGINSSASIQSGAGVLAKAGSEVTLRNCILENNTAKTAAAVDAREAGSLTMVNCVINNNTNDNESEPVIGVPSNGTCSFDHLTVVNNKGAAPAGLKTGDSMSNSFAAGNTHPANDTHGTTPDNALATMGAAGAANFTNPTKAAGATLGFDTYLGGYSEFRPLTSSAAAAQIINKGTAAKGLDNDITMTRDRDLGGMPDLGAFEAELPANGRVYYVRTDGNDGNSGLSWESAFATVRKAVETAGAGTVVNGEKPQVWVAAGTYRQDPKQGSVNCFEILDGVNVFGAFPKTGMPGMGDRHPFISDAIYHEGKYQAADYETILKPATSGNCRVLGQSDSHNPNNNNTSITYEYIYIGEGKGDYVKSESEYIPQEGGEFYFGSGNNAGYWKAASQYGNFLYVEKTGTYKFFSSEDKIATFNLDELKEEPKKLIEVGKGYGIYKLDRIIFGQQSWTTSGKPEELIYTDFTAPGYYEVNASIAGAEHFEGGVYHSVAKGRGNYIKVEAGKYYEVGKGFGNYTREGDGYINVGMGNGSWAKVARRAGAFTYPTAWDGFTLREGYLTKVSNSYRNGGAGAAVFTNVTLKNCVVTDNSNVQSGDIRGGGVYCDEGKVVNCYVQNNILGTASSKTAYGAGIYFYQGTMYNCVIHNNTGHGEFTDGAGAFIENGAFFNNTVVYNHSRGSKRQSGGIQVYRSSSQSALKIYNCISLFNEGFKVYDNEFGSNRLAGSNNFSVGNTGGNMECYNTITEDLTDVNIASDNIQRIIFDKTCIAVTDNIFSTDYKTDKPNLRLRIDIPAINPAINMGDDVPAVDGETIFLQDYTDMDFTDRIKDCRVDAGAYESENETNFGYEESKNGSVLTYYVTQTGAGSSSGDSPDNAACAMKLQRILNHAGETVRTKPEAQVIVKVAGYPDNGFVYHANTLSDPNDPQSYTYVVPYGVTLMGGYDEGYLDGKTGRMVNHNWNDDHRDAARYMTVFSAVKQGTATQDVNGYHALTFGEKPADRPAGKERKTLVDGIYLEDGAATPLVPPGDHRTRGGGAIVPEWAHLRNCVVRNNRARQGGGLYVLPGGLVTGCGILQNTATGEGGGVYADNAGNTVTASNRAHLISNTVVENTAAMGGGIYMETGAALAANMVIWGNTAGADKNISGVVNLQFTDDLFTGLQQTLSSWYPFNYCYAEQITLPSNFQNAAMTSSKQNYFGQFFTLKPYSILIDKGMVERIQVALENAVGLAPYDMQGIPRKGSASQSEKPIDVGAYAYDGGIMPTDAIVDRLFVSQASNVVADLPGEEQENYFMGKSFYTSFTTLEDALEYIEAVRNDPTVGETARNTTFEILMAQGTYIPQRQRANAAMQTYDQRLNSFTIPYNVHIYGGFTGTERYSSFSEPTRLPIEGGEPLELEAKAGIQTLCEQRSRTDHNRNGLLEPWELTAQTKLSGELNLSATEKNAYHVIFSERAKAEEGGPTAQRVLLDGLMVTKGHTYSSLKNEAAERTENEVGRGGGIYSKGIEYVLANCRLIENKAVRGGGIFIWDADCYLFNTLVAGNEVVNGTAGEDVAYGGGVFLAATKNQGKVTYNLRAINNLIVNNTSAHTGGALAVGNSSGDNVPEYKVNLANTTFARNKAYHSPVIFNSNGTSNLVNVLMWGNEGTADEANAKPNISYSVSDVDYHSFFKAGNQNRNHLIASDNDLKDGPHFQKPAQTPGAGGYDPDNSWNPVAISVAADNGNGKIDAQGNFVGDKPNYENCWTEFIPENLRDYKKVYVKRDGDAEYLRYSGPIDLETGTVKDRPVDVGYYEYQYISDFRTMAQIFVAKESRGTGKGDCWDNATDDLRGAIIGASHPAQNADTDRTIYVESGNYASLSVDESGRAFPVSTTNPTGKGQLNLTVKGSCVGGSGTGDRQDFSKPSRIAVHPQKKGVTKQLMDISVNSAKTVTIEGFSFTNPTAMQEGGIGVNVTNVASGGQVVLRQSAFRMNSNGLQIGPDALNGKLLAVNTLFADNGTGLANTAGDNITLVNTTFANNRVADMSRPVANTCNSVAWNNGADNMPAGKDNQLANVSFGKFNDAEAAAANNANVLEGPNFRDPLNTEVAERDYRIRPGLMLLDKGSNALYVRHGTGQSGQGVQIPDTEKDLHGINRKVGENIDIGAYEYEALLQPIVYVKSNLATGTADGSSWGNATGDLQGAVDLAGVYANNAKGRWAYVFADRNVKPDEPLSITLPNVKVYGGLDGEVYMTEDADGNMLPVSQPAAGITAQAIVDTLLHKRAGLLMQGDHSTLGFLQLNANAVVDGFRIDGGAEVNHGILATSVVSSTDAGTAVAGNTSEGMLYNSLVYGSVSGVKAVNVTATGTIAGAAGSGNNRPEVAGSGVNRYVATDHWKYQLNETDAGNLNKGTVDPGTPDDPASIIASVGHGRDLIGNRRVRDAVDNGCFETWYLPGGGKATADDYPMGQSVVYVGSGKELLLEKEYTAAGAFSPGFLLLEHQAGLRGNGRAVNLKNFAVERRLPQAATTPPRTGGEGTAAGEKVYGPAVMPFTVTKAEGIAEGTAGGVKLYSYDSKKRAGFAYKFDKDKGAWTDTGYGEPRNRLTIGWLIEGKPGAKVRFYGKSYEENGQPKQLSLKKENHNDPWSSQNSGGNRFTHKENMSWNLFGSPYLCAMKYADMGYGRVMYGMPEGNGYVTLQTCDAANDAVIDGYIPAGDAVFTQTATLKEYETLDIALPAVGNTPDEDVQPYAGQQTLQVALARTQATPAGGAAADAADVLQLRAVDEADARTDFDLGSDGVKWTTPGGRPQIYALQDGGHYSLLSAVNREGSVQVGVQLPAAGSYRFFLPENCDLTDYGVVLLHDAQTGQSADLTEGAYAFTTVEEGNVEARFTLSFVRKDSQLAKGIRVCRLSERSFRIEGLQPGDRIRLFGTDGRQVAAQTAAAATETVEAYMPATAIVEVKRNGRPAGVVKVR